MQAYIIIEKQTHTITYKHRMTAKGSKICNHWLMLMTSHPNAATDSSKHRKWQPLRSWYSTQTYIVCSNFEKSAILKHTQGSVKLLDQVLSIFASVSISLPTIGASVQEGRAKRIAVAAVSENAPSLPRRLSMSLSRTGLSCALLFLSLQKKTRTFEIHDLSKPQRTGYL